MLGFISLALGLTACGGSNGNTEISNSGNKTENVAVTTANSEQKKEEFTGDVKFPFDFPNSATTAKAGENGLCRHITGWLMQCRKTRKW